MTMKRKTTTIAAPQPTTSGSLPSNRVIDVEVGADEEVEWTWTTLPGGQRYVSGYTLNKKPG